MPKVKLLEPAAAQKLDRYELIGEIAAGGMATVYLGRLAGAGGFQRFVAVKRLHPHLAHEAEFVEMFLDEARLAAGIHHPHVVPILEVGTSEDGFYLVMEYVEGDTLARLMALAVANQALPPRPVLLRILLDALAGLHAAHELLDAHGDVVGLVHRDMSPQNVLVGVDGCTRITDFGVARANSRLNTTATGRLKGKLAYMAPEQANGDDLDRRADLFSMGTLLWELLAGRRLFKGENDVQTLHRLLVAEIPRVSTVAPDVPEALAAVSARALERDRSARFQTAAEFADAIERAVRDAGPTLAVASPREVAAYVRDAIGQEISLQRDSVRAWLAQSEPTSRVESTPTPLDRPLVIPLARPTVKGFPPPPPVPSRPTLPDSPVAAKRAPEDDALTRVRAVTSLSSASMSVAASQPSLSSAQGAGARPESGRSPGSAPAKWAALVAILFAVGMALATWMQPSNPLEEKSRALVTEPSPVQATGAPGFANSSAVAVISTGVPAAPMAAPAAPPAVPAQAPSAHESASSQPARATPESDHRLTPSRPRASASVSAKPPPRPVVEDLSNPYR